MDTDKACEFINKRLCFIPGWDIEAEPYEKRFQGMCLVHFSFPAQNSNEGLAPDYTVPIPGKNRATLKVEVGDCTGELDVYKRVLDAVIRVQTHEAREFLRVHVPEVHGGEVIDRWVAPYHPHRWDGMNRWGDVQGDLDYNAV